MKNKKEAKNIFEKYKCSHFHMFRENEAEYMEYKKYNISKEQEFLWIGEHLDAKLKKLQITVNNKEVAKLVEDICYYASIVSNLNVFFYLCKYIEKKYMIIDTNTVIRIANAIMNLYNSLKYKNDLCKESNSAMQSVFCILKKVQNKEVTVSSDYKINGTYPDYLTKERIEENLLAIIKGYGQIVRG